jgi:hypothetical protein
VASRFHVTIVPVVGNAGAAGDKWNPYTPAGRIQKELFGSDPEIDYLAATQPSPEVTRAVLGFVPGLNSVLVFNDPKATTFDKTLAVGTDVLAVVGVGAVVKLGAKGVGLAKGVVLGAEAAEEVAQLGGSYRAVRAAATEAGLGGEVHHMPSWAATRGAGVADVTRWNAPSIWMETADHYSTLSHGRLAGSSGYRATQETFIRSGQHLDAMKMDVDNVRALFGTKYDGAIQQMGEYVWEFHK